MKIFAPRAQLHERNDKRTINHFSKYSNLKKMYALKFIQNFSKIYFENLRSTSRQPRVKLWEIYSKKKYSPELTNNQSQLNFAIATIPKVLKNVEMTIFNMF